MNLRHGPRNLHQATCDFMHVARAFLQKNAPIVARNQFGELEVTIGYEIFNLTKILEHKPDFEHMNFVLTREENRTGTELLVSLTEDYQYEAVDYLTENEARAIHYYTLPEEHGKNGQYRIINEFLRKNGMINHIGVNKNADLKTILCALIYLPQALIKLRRTHLHENLEREDTTHRAEKYSHQSQAYRVISDRVHLGTTRIELSFFSTSQKDRIVKETFAAANNNEHNILISVSQICNTFGANIAKYSACRTEAEVLFIPGTQFVYQRDEGNPDLLFAKPVRALNDLFSDQYSREIISFRSTILKLVDKANNKSRNIQILTSTMTGYCRSICHYGADEAASTLKHSDEIIEKLQSISINTVIEREEINTFLFLVRKVKITCELKIKKQTMMIRLKDEEMCDHDLIARAKEVYRLYLCHVLSERNLHNVDAYVNLNNQTIHRPNHGLAHSIRVALYVPAIVIGYRSHTNNAHFSQFLSEFNDSTLSLIQLALLHSVTGRESELSFKENLQKSREYRLKSEENFSHYVLSYPREFEFETVDTIEMLAVQIREMGHPAYLESLEKELRHIESQALTEDARHAQQYSVYKKIFTYLIIDMAHKLDLMRCFSKREYEAAVAIHLKQLSPYVKNTFYNKVMPSLYEMATLSLHATGDRLLTQYNCGALRDVEIYYEAEKFVLCSQDPQACIEACFTKVPILVAVHNGAESIDANLPLTMLQKSVLDGDFDVYQLLRLKGDSISNNLLKAIGSYELYKDDSQLNKLMIAPESSQLEPADLVVALHYCITRKLSHYIAYLILYKVDVNFSNAKGESPLYLAVKFGDLTSAEYLVRSGANIWQETNYDQTVVERLIDQKRYFLLFLAVDGKDLEADKKTEFNKLLSFGLDNVQDHFAAQLLKKYAYDPDQFRENGRTIIHHAALNNMVDTLGILMAKKFDPCPLDHEGHSPLYYAARFPKLNTLTILIEACVASNSKDLAKHCHAMINRIIANTMIGNSISTDTKVFLKTLTKLLIDKEIKIIPEILLTLYAMTAKDANELVLTIAHILPVQPHESFVAANFSLHFGAIDIFTKLIELTNCNVNQTIGGKCLLATAVAKKIPCAVTALFENQAYFNIDIESDHAIFMQAIQLGNFDIIKALVIATLKNSTSQKPGQLANEKILKVLIDKYLHNRTQNRDLNYTLLDLLAFFSKEGLSIKPGYTIAVKAIHNIRDLDTYDLKIILRLANLDHTDINAQLINSEFTALESSIVECNAGIMQLLLQHPDIDINMLSPAHAHMTPLILALTHNRFFDILLADPRIDVTSKDNSPSGNTILHTAIAVGDMRSIKALVEHPRVDIHAKNNDGITALQLAVSLKKEEVVSFLLDKYGQKCPEHIVDSAKIFKM